MLNCKNINESTLEDSFIYRSFNASNGFIDKFVKYIKTSIALTKDDFDEQYFQMKKVAISPLTPRVIEAFDNGLIEILYSNSVKIGVSFPFIIRKNENGKIVATIFVSSFGTMDKNGNLNIPLKQLYGLMESAYIALQLQMNPQKIQRNMGIMKLMTSVYSEMMLRILNKEYSLSLDKELNDKALYILNRFFLERIWEYPTPTTVQAYATQDLNYIGSLDLDLLETGYDNAQIKDFDSMIAYMRTISPRMNDLNSRYFIERYINAYYGSSILSIDYLPYVFFVVTNTLLGTFLVSQTALNDIIKNIKGMNKFYPELSKLI